MSQIQSKRNAKTKKFWKNNEKEANHKEKKPYHRLSSFVAIHAVEAAVVRFATRVRSLLTTLTHFAASRRILQFTAIYRMTTGNRSFKVNP